MNGQEFHLFRTGLDLVDLSGQVLSEFLRVMLARRAYSKGCSPGRDPVVVGRSHGAVSRCLRQRAKRLDTARRLQQRLLRR